MPQHAAACRSEPKFSRGGLFFHTTSKLSTLCCTDVSELDGSSVVNCWAAAWRILGSIPGKGTLLPVSSSILIFAVVMR